jgi:hypothetical protein
MKNTKQIKIKERTDKTEKKVSQSEIKKNKMNEKSQRDMKCK